MSGVTTPTTPKTTNTTTTTTTTTPTTDTNSTTNNNPPQKNPSDPANRTNTVVVGENKKTSDHDYNGRPDKDDYDYDGDGKLNEDEVKDFKKDIQDYKSEMNKEREFKEKMWKSSMDAQNKQEQPKAQGSILGKAIPGTKI
jgi:hypothetical protein